MSMGAIFMFIPLDNAAAFCFTQYKAQVPLIVEAYTENVKYMIRIENYLLGSRDYENKQDR